MHDWLLVRQRGFLTSRELGYRKKRYKIAFNEDALQKTSSDVLTWTIERERLGKQVIKLKKRLEIASRNGDVIIGDFSAGI